MKLTKLCYMAAAVAAAGLVYNASAWPDYRWTGLGGDDMWTNVNNWTNLTTFNKDLPEDEATTLFAVQVDQANGSANCIIPAGYTVDLNDVYPPTIYNTLYGPEWGMKMSIYGNLKYQWMMAPVGGPQVGARTIINMYNGSSLQTLGAGFGIGDAWWWFEAAPYVTVNMYGNAQIIANNTATNNLGLIGLGGHLNVYDTAVVNVNSVFTGNGDAVNGGYSGTGNCSDATASLNIGGGTLMLPTGATNVVADAGNSVYDLIGRGVLRAYGKVQDTNDLVIADNGTNTTVTTVALGGSLQQIYLEPLCDSTMNVGAYQQVVVAGDYPSVSGVLLSSAEPGVDPATLPGTVTYTSSNPNVATVNADGLVTAIAPGTTTLSATCGTFTTTNTSTVTVVSASSTLAHRYSFNETSGTNAADSVGGSAWDGSLYGTGTAFSNGSVVLTGATNNAVLADGLASYVSLPAGVVSNMSEITIETWVTCDSVTTNSIWEYLFAFGTTGTDPLASSFGIGANYISFCPYTAGTTASLNFGKGIPGNQAEIDSVIGTLIGQTNIQIVGVFSPDTGTETLYTNGVFAANNTGIYNVMMDPAAFNGPMINKGSIVSATLGADPINYLGESLWRADPGFKGSINEFRIYNGVRSAAQIAADNALGPNQLIGASTNVTLTATPSGGNVVLSWPTNSALVTVQGSPVLGPGATWTPVTGTLTAAGGSYRMVVPVGGATRFFRLQ